jgi:hypothetical protein
VTAGLQSCDVQLLLLLLLLLLQVVPMPEPLEQRLQKMRDRGQALAAAELTYLALLNPRMIVARLVMALLPPPGTDPPPLLKRLVGRCATREVVAWLLSSAIAVGCGECTYIIGGCTLGLV